MGVVSPRFCNRLGGTSIGTALGLAARRPRSNGHAGPGAFDRRPTQAGIKESDFIDQLARQAACGCSRQVRIVATDGSNLERDPQCCLVMLAGMAFAIRRRSAAVMRFCITNRCNFSRSSLFIERACPTQYSGFNCPRPKPVIQR